jgi:acetate kinase
VRVLVVNAGSSTIKLVLLDGDDTNSPSASWQHPELPSIPPSCAKR